MGRHSVAYARRIRSLVRLLVVLSLCLACTVPGHTAARPRTQSQPAGEIAYVDQADIWLLDVVTKQRTQLTHTGEIDSLQKFKLAWSPDGQWLLFASTDNDNLGIVMIRADGSDRTRVTESPADEYFPTVSMSDGALFFVQTASPTDASPPIVPSTMQEFQIVKRDRAGAETVLQRLPPFIRPMGLSAPAGDPLALSVCGGGGCSTDLIDAANGQAQPTSLASYFQQHGAQGNCVLGPESIAATAALAHARPLLALGGDADCADEESQGWSAGVFVLDLAHDDMRLLYPGDRRSVLINTIDWSPDDQWLVFDRFNYDHRASEGIWIMPSQGGEAQQLLDVGASPAWRPDTAPPVSPTEEPTATSPATPVPPTPTDPPTAVPLATAIPPVDPAEAQRWMSEKATLIAHLESVDIPAGIFTVPGVSAYNEAAARSLLAHRQDQVDQGSLTPEQLEAFARLTVHERALSQMLPIYTSVAASLAETHIDIIRTSFGLLFVMQPAWNACQGTLPSCGPLQELSSRHLMTLARDASKLLARRATTEPGQQKNLVNAADLVARLVEDKLAGGQSLQELLLDKGAQFMLTTVMIGPYLGRTQQLLDRGVRTAELERPTDDRWPISGSTERAALNVEGLVTQADIHRQDALRRYQDFQQGADVTRVADDIAKLVTLSPLAAIATAVSVGARIERMTVVDLPLVILNSQKLSCIEALSTRAAGLAFDAAQPAFIGSCPGQAARSVPRGNLILAAYQRHAPAGTLQAQLEQDAEQYRQALQPLAAAVQQQDSNAIAQALDRVTQADARLSARLEAMQSLILSRPAVDQPVQDVLERLRSFQARSLVLDLSLAETLMARQAKQMPQSDLAGAIGAALASIDEVERAAAPLDLSAPAGRSLLQIQSVKAAITPGQQLQIDVDVQNIGASPSVDGQLHLMSKDALGAIAAQTSLDAIAPGDEARVTLHAPLQAGGTFTLQLWTSDGLQDLYLAALPQSMGAPSTTPGSAQPSLRVDVPAIGAAVLLWSWPIGIGVVMMLAAVAFGSLHRSRRRRTNAPTKHSGYGEETRRAEARERVALRRPPADVPARQQDPPAIRSTAATEPHTPVATSGAAIAQTPMPSAAPIPSPAIVRRSDDQKLSILLLLFTRDVVPKVPAIKVALAAATLRGQPLRDWLSPSVILRVGVDPRAHDPEWARTFGNEQLRRLMGAQFSPEHVETMRFGAGTEITGTILGHWASNDDSDDTSPRQA